MPAYFWWKERGVTPWPLTWLRRCASSYRAPWRVRSRLTKPSPKAWKRAGNAKLTMFPHKSLSVWAVIWHKHKMVCLLATHSLWEWRAGSNSSPSNHKHHRSINTFPSACSTDKKNYISSKHSCMQHIEQINSMNEYIKHFFTAPMFSKARPFDLCSNTFSVTIS